MAAETGDGFVPEPQSLTGRDNYFEDFNLGDVYEHARGKTVGGLDNVLITNLVMNTAQAHFNEHRWRPTRSAIASPSAASPPRW